MPNIDFIRTPRIAISSKEQFAIDVLPSLEKSAVQGVISRLTPTRIPSRRLHRFSQSKYFSLRAGPTLRVIVSNVNGKFVVEDVVNDERLRNFNVRGR